MMIKNFTIKSALACLAGLILLPATDAFAARHTVTVRDFAFSPQFLTIHAGDTVVWQWQSGSHPVAPDNGSDFTAFMSSSATPTVEKKFISAGTVGYHCTAHGSAGSGMYGRITVQNVAGIRQEVAQLNIQAYPNPTAGPVTFSLQDRQVELTKLQISNSIGTVVKELKLPELRGAQKLMVNLQDLPGGVYFCTFFNEDSMLHTQRLILNK